MENKQRVGIGDKVIYKGKSYVIIHFYTDSITLKKYNNKYTWFTSKYNFTIDIRDIGELELMQDDNPVGYYIPKKKDNVIGKKGFKKTGHYANVVGVIEHHKDKNYYLIRVNKNEGIVSHINELELVDE